MNYLVTRATRLTLCSSIIIALAACGHSTPSESDAKQAVKASLGDCKYVSMSDFEKVNGQQGDDENHYEVQIKYKLTLEADSDQRDKLETHLDRMKERNKLIKEEEQIRVSFMNQGRGSDANNDATWKDLDQKQQTLYRQLTTTYGPATFVQELGHACPNFSSSVLGDLVSKTDDVAFDGKNTVDYSGTIAMVKTDNGWQADR
ncbi:hypothetical protein [Trinickia dinghuensis]|uniref:Uncharacterized protein n=1 Tax=Trinickia dinghuensis TaxID=2291023 RepID=A0A3D8K0Z9_9BURK|nr:hypothetical protein [Trinickia dinghuensis]RDU98281.1 hypothetical protein DWV00_13260 [Trinickia dinghuensis]